VTDSDYLMVVPAAEEVKMPRIPTDTSPDLLGRPSRVQAPKQIDVAAEAFQAVGQATQQVGRAMEEIGARRQAFEDRRYISNKRNEFNKQMNQFVKENRNTLDNQGYIGKKHWEEVYNDEANRLKKQLLSDAPRARLQREAGLRFDNLIAGQTEVEKSFRFKHSTRMFFEEQDQHFADMANDAFNDSDIQSVYENFQQNEADLDGFMSEEISPMTPQERIDMSVGGRRKVADSYFHGQLDSLSDRGPQTMLGLQQLKAEMLSAMDQKTPPESDEQLAAKEMFKDFSQKEMANYINRLDRMIASTQAVNDKVDKENLQDIKFQLREGQADNWQEGVSAGLQIISRMDMTPRERQREVSELFMGVTTNEFRRNLNLMSNSELMKQYPTEKDFMEAKKGEMIENTKELYKNFLGQEVDFKSFEMARMVDQHLRVSYSQMKAMQKDRLDKPYDSVLQENPQLARMDGETKGLAELSMEEILEIAPAKQDLIRDKLLPMQRENGVFPSKMQVAGEHELASFGEALRSSGLDEKAKPAFMADLYDKVGAKYGEYEKAFYMDALTKGHMNRLQYSVATMSNKQAQKYALQSIQANKELTKLFQNDPRMKEINEAVLDQLETYTQAMNQMGRNGETISLVNDYSTIIKSHAMQRVLEGVDAAEAVEEGVNLFINGNYNVVENTVGRQIPIPLQHNGEPINQAAVDQFIDAFEPSFGQDDPFKKLFNQFNVVVPAAFGDRDRWVEEMQDKTDWHVSPNGDGLVLGIKQPLGHVIPIQHEVDGKREELIIKWKDMRNVMINNDIPTFLEAAPPLRPLPQTDRVGAQPGIRR